MTLVMDVLARLRYAEVAGSSDDRQSGKLMPVLRCHAARTDWVASSHALEHSHHGATVPAALLPDIERRGDPAGEGLPCTVRVGIGR